MRGGLFSGFSVLLACTAACAPDDEAVTTVQTRFARRSAPAVRLPAGPRTDLELVVKFTDAARVRTRGPDALHARGGADLREVEALRDRYGLTFAPLVRVAEPRIDALRERARVRSGRPQPDILGFSRATVPEATPELLVEVGTALQRLPVVEVAYVHATRPPPPVDIDPPTPDLEPLQTYRGSETGIDVDGAAALGYDGSGIRIADVEQNWDLAHEEWADLPIELEEGVVIWPDHGDPNHGTAVIGTLIAGDNGYGVTGMTPAATLGLYPEIIGLDGQYRRADAIASAVADAAVGDVVLLEIQETEPLLGEYGPGEIEEAVWMITRMGVDAGVVVVAAAGNGNVDLDREELAYYRDRGDSGAIIVGAGAPDTRDKLSFSTFGSRVDVQGWGSGVFTTGYGNYAMYGDDPRQSYTAGFAGTSSASPIVAAAAVLVQQAAKERLGTSLTSEQMRTVLVGSGLPQGAGGHIGPLPQVPLAIQAASTPDLAAPSVAIVTPNGDVAVQESTFATAIEVDATDDSGVVTRVELAIDGKVQPTIDDIEPWAFDEVVFPAGTYELVAIATDIWGNVGESPPVTIAVGVDPPPASTGMIDASSSGGDDSTTAPPPPPPAPTTGGPEPDDTDATATDGPDQAPSGADDGCGCHGAPAHPTRLLPLLLLPLLTRRRRVRPG